MSWRRFTTLLRGLPAESALVQHLGRVGRERALETDEGIEAFLAQAGW